METATKVTSKYLIYLDKYLKNYPFEGTLHYKYYIKLVPNATSLNFYNFKNWVQVGLERKDQEILELLDLNSSQINSNIKKRRKYWEIEKENSRLLVPSIESLSKKAGFFHNEVD